MSAKHSFVFLCIISLSVAIFTGCDQTVRRLEQERIAVEKERIELEKQREEREQAERKAAEKREKERRRLDPDRLKSLAQSYANQAGSQIAETAAPLGYNDLQVKIISHKFNKYDSQFEIEMEVHFNGLFTRSNHYECDGTLMVSEGGENPQFVRSWSNEMFKKLESQVKWAVIIGGTAIILNEMSKPSE